jgi:hypothetical protein
MSRRGVTLENPNQLFSCASRHGATALYAVPAPSHR